MGRSARLTDRSCNELWLSIILLLVVSVRLLLRRVKAALSKPGRVGTFHAWGSHFFQAVLQLRENHLPLQPISLFSADNYLQAVISCRFPMASRTPIYTGASVRVCASLDNGSVSCQYHMDLVFHQNRFHCKLRTSARLSTQKQTHVYLILDASHVHSMEICGRDDDDDERTILPSVNSALATEDCNTLSNDVVCIRFGLKNHSPLIIPDLALRRQASSCQDIETLLRIGQCKTFNLYVSSDATSRQRLSSLCRALDEGVLRPAPENLINSLYVNVASKAVTSPHELWIQSVEPPPYDFTTAPGAGNNESIAPSDFTLPRSPKVSGKRRLTSSDRRTEPSKRQFLLEEPSSEPWEVAIAAQAAQLAVLHAEVMTLRQEMQQFRHISVVVAETKIVSTTELEARADLEPSSVAGSGRVISSQASTIMNTNEDFLMLGEENIINRREQKALLDAEFDHNDEQVCTQGLSETDNGQMNTHKRRGL
jgi:hypothetical protein